MLVSASDDSFAYEKAFTAIEKGSTGFLQTTEANVLRTLAIEKATLAAASREELLSFLSGTQAEGYVPQSGEIVGILTRSIGQRVLPMQKQQRKQLFRRTKL
jgi:hypothetical protein